MFALNGARIEQLLCSELGISLFHQLRWQNRFQLDNSPEPTLAVVWLLLRTVHLMVFDHQKLVASTQLESISYWQSRADWKQQWKMRTLRSNKMEIPYNSLLPAPMHREGMQKTTARRAWRRTGSKNKSASFHESMVDSEWLYDLNERIHPSVTAQKFQYLWWLPQCAELLLHLSVVSRDLSQTSWWRNAIKETESKLAYILACLPLLQFIFTWRDSRHRTPHPPSPRVEPLSTDRKSVV